MTKAVPSFAGFYWLAKYVGRDGRWITAKDARGVPLRCASEELALSVAASRRGRLETFN